FIEQQVSFGARVPNTPAHEKCANYLIDKLKAYHWQVTPQQFEAKAFDGTVLKSTNIIASLKPDLKKRILLAAHWDSRPFADQDSQRKEEAILGANDGGSGVGVLLEIARLLQSDTAKLTIGIDIIFFDSEDYGQREDQKMTQYQPDTWCLGSQYWGKNKHNASYSAFYGVLLDMVGAKNAKFYQEENSMKFAPSIVQRFWSIGHQLGYKDYFIFEPCGNITDDHLYVNQLAKIPMIDVIQYHPQHGFGEFWHKHSDNMAIIDKNTLKAVGQTLVQMLYNENVPVQ
ncbi:MAG: M28 family peptidase, partial [Thermoflexibacter sp.]|nr:M28 family peptidase [Thermoflexibacter sp.]